MAYVFLSIDLSADPEQMVDDAKVVPSVADAIAYFHSEYGEDYGEYAQDLADDLARDHATDTGEDRVFAIKECN